MSIYYIKNNIKNVKYLLRNSNLQEKDSHLERRLLSFLYNL